MVTTFMSRMFSASADEEQEVLEQTAKDIEAAKESGKVVDNDNQLEYVNLGEGVVQVTDLGHGGEITLVSQAEDGNYDLEPGNPAVQSEQIEGYLHPEVGDTVEVGAQEGAPDEKVEDHMNGAGVIAPNKANGGLNPEAGQEATVEENAETGEGRQIVEGGESSCPEEDDEEREFSVSTDNSVVLRIFSDQAYCERIFSDCIECDESAKVGNLVIEKVEDEDAVIVKDVETGDAAKVTLDDENLDVQELDQKELSKYYSEDEDEDEYEDEEYAGAPAAPGAEEEFDALHVVGVDPINHIIVDAPVYSEEDAQDLVGRLEEDGVSGVSVFECPSEARDYAIDLLNNLGAESEDDVEEPEQVEYSDHTIFVTRFYSDHTDYMMKIFSEAADGVSASQDVIEDAIENGDEIEVDGEIITPVDATTAVVEDKENGEFTKVTLDGEEMNLDPITESEAEELTEDLAVSEDGEDEDEPETEEEVEDDAEAEDEEEDADDADENDEDDEEEKEFSEEDLTDYMIRMFSEDSESSQDDIEDAIESGEQIENDTEVITPVDATTAVIEDKESGEFTKATILDDDNMDVSPISEDEADELTEDLAVEDSEGEDEDEEEKKYSEDPVLDDFFTKAFNELNAAEQEVIQAVRDPQTGELVPLNPEPEGEEVVPSLEAIEDKALQAVQSIQEAAAEASAQIIEAKQTPAVEEQEDLQEAQFSEGEQRTFSDSEDTLVSWFKGNSLLK